MSFNLQKYLIENNLTLTGAIRLREEDEEAATAPPETTPTDSANKPTDADTRDLEKNKKEVEKLKATAKDIIFKYTKETPQGRKLKVSVEDYNKAIGKIPERIKFLQKKIDAVEPPSEEEK